MRKLGEIVRYAREQKGWNIQRLADELGIQVSAMSKKERGLLRIKPDEKVAIAEALDITVQDLERMSMGIPPKETRTGQIKGHLGDIPVLNRASAGFVTDYTIDGGSGTDLYSGANEYLSRGDLMDELAFALIVQGDSMEPVVRQGDYLIFSPVRAGGPREPKPGDVVCVYFSEESSRRGAIIGLFAQADGHVIISKANTKYPPIMVEPKDIARLGVAVEMRRKIVQG